MDELVRWLGEQLDEDERVARECAGNGEWDADDIAIYGPDLAPEVRQHMAEHDPARVLREIDAKRRILAEHALNGWVCSTCDNGEVEQVFPCPTLRLLALPYADRPGYREAWRP
ncbi:DUF6221 family protein [Streptomyces cucumeris]|uniref:DUF6221 family protein n=1 Tax=Streptomyces cucumeris TaxID=2962890 RepID=UPI003D75B0A4